MPASPVARYVVAVLATAAAVAFRVALTPILGTELPFVTLFPAIAAAVWFGGVGPGIVAAVLGYLGINAMLFAPPGMLLVLQLRDSAALVAYSVAAAVIVSAGALMHRERRRAEAAGRDAAQQREWFRTSLASIGDGVLATDSAARITFMNPVAERLTGWTLAEADHLPLEQVFRIVNEETRHPAENPALRALRDGIVVGLANHTLLLHRSGSEHPVDDSAAPIRDDQGTVRGVVLVFRDVTERRRAERLKAEFQSELERLVEERTAELRRSEEVFRLLVEGARDHAIMLLDPAGRVASWNPGAELIEGYRAEEVLGEHFSRFYPEEDVRAGKPERGLGVARTTGRFAEEGWRIRKDGSRFWASAVIAALFDPDGSLRGYAKITRDETVRKVAEDRALELAAEQAARAEVERAAEQIRAQREQLRVTLESIGDAVITTDSAGRVTMLNPVAAQLTGWTEAEALGEELPSVFAIRNELTGLPAENPAARVLREGVVVGLANHTTLTSRDGTVRAIDDSAAPILGPHGGLAGVVLVFRDVTERRRLEAELTARMEQLGEADRRKDEFLAILAHELRNPLAPLRNALALLRMDQDPARSESVLALMDRQLNHIVRLVNDLLDVSRVTRGELVLRRAPVDLATVLQHAIETSRHLIDRRGHELAVEPAEEPVLLDADLTRLSQVFANLLHNAAKFTEPGGRIRLSARREGSDVVVSVRDTGIGIGPEMLPRVFDLFTQGDPSLERAQGGLGIGLSLVKRLVELHGGSVEARSDGAGRGSEFQVRLPLRVSQALHATASRDERPPTASRRILIVDDNQDAATSLARVMELAGHRTSAVDEPRAALQTAETFQPDVVILDIGMPGLNGYEVCRRMRTRPWARSAVFIAVTGWGQEQDKQRATEAGFTAHLVKPVDPVELDRLLGGLLPAPRA